MVRAYFDWEKINPFKYPNDIKIIQAICVIKGFEISPYDVHMAWTAYSNDYCADWIMLPDSDEDIWKAIESYLKFEKDEWK